MYSIRTLIATRFAAFAFAAVFTAGMLGGVNALAVDEAPAQQMSQQGLQPVA